MQVNVKINWRKKTNFQYDPVSSGIEANNRQPAGFIKRSMSKVNIRKEIIFKTARSGGKGGQNVNKVETMVEGYFDIDRSNLLDDNQKQLIKQKLRNKINAEGLLLVKSQTERTQLGNKQMVVEKMNDIISQSLIKPRKRIAGKPGEAARQKRIDEKKIKGRIKEGRRKVRPED